MTKQKKYGLTSGQLPRLDTAASAGFVYFVF